MPAVKSPAGRIAGASPYRWRKIAIDWRSQNRPDARAGYAESPKNYGSTGFPLGKWKTSNWLEKLGCASVNFYQFSFKRGRVNSLWRRLEEQLAADEQPV